MSFPPPIESLTLRVTTGVSPSVEIFEQDILPSDLSGTTNNSVQIAPNSSVFNAFNTKQPGTIFNASIITTYDEGTFITGDTISTASVSNYVPNPLILSSFGSLSYNYVSGGVGTFTLSQPSSNSNSPGAFTYSVVGTTGIVSVSTNVVTILSAGSTTIRATQAAAGNYTSAYVDASVTINPIAPTFGSFSIASRDFGAIPFTLTAPTSNSSGAFTYTSSNLSVATVNSTTGVITIVSAGTTTIRATQAATVNYTSAYVEATLLVNVAQASILTWSGITKSVTRRAFPLIGDLAPSSNVTLSYGNMWNLLGQDIDGEADDDQSGSSVSLSADGTIVAIGAVYNYGNGSYRGHVRVYKYDSTKTTAVTDQSSSDYGPVGWRRLGQDIDGEADDDLSGYRVSLSADGTIVAIGANYNSAIKGHVRVYEIDSFGNFTYTSDTPAVADVYGNIVLLRSTGYSTLTATQSATSSSLSGTTDTTLTVTS